MFDTMKIAKIIEFILMNRKGVSMYWFLRAQRYLNIGVENKGVDGNYMKMLRSQGLRFMVFGVRFMVLACADIIKECAGIIKAPPDLPGGEGCLRTGSLLQENEIMFYQNGVARWDSSPLGRLGGA